MNVGNKKKRSVNCSPKDDVSGKLKNDKGNSQEEEDKLIGDDRAMERALHGGADIKARLENEKNKY